MPTKTAKEVWGALGLDMSRERMDIRLRDAVSQRRWREAVRIFARQGKPVSSLKVAEIGCGTGTMALSFCIAGASVTLVDLNESVLERTKKIYEMYGCSADLIAGDCLKEPPASLAGTFDLVMSLGLAEHFSNGDRKRCFEYHALLAKPGGAVFIGVPNRLSLLYWCIRAFRKLTGTWVIDIEIPFSPAELISMARSTGLKDPYVVGCVDLRKDFIEHLYGFRSAVADLLPRRFIGLLKGKRTLARGSHISTDDMKRYCLDMEQEAGAGSGEPRRRALTDRYCSNIALFAFR